MKYFHGGKPFLRIGDYILPPTVTGEQHCSSDEALPVHDPSRVYVTDSKKAAKLFAAMHPSNKGIVYEVVPEGELVADTDFYGWVIERGIKRDFASYSCERAKIVAAYPLMAAERKLLHRLFKEMYG